MGVDRTARDGSGCCFVASDKTMCFDRIRLFIGSLPKHRSTRNVVKQAAGKFGCMRQAAPSTSGG